MEPTKLWLWRTTEGANYLAYDNPMPCHPDGGDPLVLGEPAATALLMPSTPGWKHWTADGKQGSG